MIKNISKSIKKRLFLYPLLIILFIHIISFGYYIYNKTLGYDKTDCMIQYINKYYPYGSVYKIDGKYPHIDKRGIDYLDDEVKIYKCFINDSFRSLIFNTPYCYITLISEKILEKFK